MTSTPLSLPTGASIRDNSNNNASLVLPIGLKSLSGNKDLVIDNTRPVTPSRPIVVNKTGIIATSTGEMVDVTDNNEVTFTVSCLT